MNLPSERAEPLLSTFYVAGTEQAPDIPVPFGKTTCRGGHRDGDFTNEESGSVRKSDCTRHITVEWPGQPWPVASALSFLLVT